MLLVTSVFSDVFPDIHLPYFDHKCPSPTVTAWEEHGANGPQLLRDCVTQTGKQSRPAGVTKGEGKKK